MRPQVHDEPVPLIWSAVWVGLSMCFCAFVWWQFGTKPALEWLSAVSAEPDDLPLKLWRVYAALWVGEWDTARRFIAALPDGERSSLRWRYWTARLLERAGEADAAKPMYAALARERDYYGFLAADRVGADYAMQHVAVDATTAE